MKGKIIGFVGIDGSGKSLQAQLLADAFRKQGYDCKLLWVRWTPFFLRPFIVVANIFLRKKEERYLVFIEKKRKIFKFEWQKQLWWTFVLLDYFCQLFIKVVVNKWMNKIIICDRFYYDSLIDQAINFGYSGKKMFLLTAHPLFKILPRPDIVFFLDIEPEIAYNRKCDPFTSLDYLKDRRIRYIEFAKKENWICLDASLNVEDLHGIIMKKIKDIQKNE